MADDRTSLQRFRQSVDPGRQAQLHLDAARILARQGDAAGARCLLRAAIEADPACVQAWQRLASLADDPHDRQAYLRQVLALDPSNLSARAELAEPAPPSLLVPAPPARRPVSARLLLLLAVVAVAAVAAVLVWGPIDASLARLLPTPTPASTPLPTLAPGQIVAEFAPQLQTALSQADWQRAFEIVDIMDSVDPGSDEVRRWTVTVHLTYGQALVRARQTADALVQFDQAVALAPAGAEAVRWQQAARSFLVGQQALAAGDWTAAIEALTPVRDAIPDYPDTVASMAQAYRQRGIAHEQKARYQEARADLEAALALQPGDAEAQAHLDAVMFELFPPKRIEIDIGDQRFYAWEGDNLIYRYATSTGLPGRDTATGHYHVLDKIPMAYSSIWRLKMPYWLGIYYVGGIENGIHALPIRPDGSVMWGGLLGTKQSYGCVILDTAAAKKVYDWAEIGIPVDIHY
ncbi:MAG: L,D-transpeptidase family protein [Anaerolineae bacterium]|nr:L,D-transpeptidase family protein [Anaerolineae bacterium]